MSAAGADITSFDANALGLIAGFFTTLSSIPQIVRSLRTRSMRDLSPTAMAMYAFGVALWLIYGFLIHAPAVIFWNGVTFALYCALFALRMFGR